MSATGRRVVAALAGLAAIGTPAIASAALLWTLVASPLAVATGAATTFRLTATNLDLLSAIRCVVVNVPGSFSVDGATLTGSSAGNSWNVVRVGNRVTVWTTSGGDELRLADTVGFTIHATALSAGSLAWAANAFARSDCAGAGSLLGVPPIIVVTGPPVTPTPSATPSPTPVPTAVPTAVPTPVPTPIPSVPVVLPPPSTPGPTVLASASLPPSVIGTPPAIASPGRTASAVPARTAAATPSPRATVSPAPVPGGPVFGSGGPSRPTPDLALRGQFQVGGAPSGPVDISVDGLGISLGLATWAVPAATLGLPGLLVLLWVAAQAVGALAWIPAVRRLRGEETEPSLA